MAAPRASTSSRGERVELRGAVERQPDPPRGRRREKDRFIGHGWHPWDGPPRTTSASTATAPSTVAMTGFKSTSRRSCRSIARFERAAISAATACRSTAGRPRGPASSREPRSSSSIAFAVSGLTGASRMATSSSTSARTPPRPTTTHGPNDGSRRRPTISSSPASAIGSRSRPRASTPWWRAIRNRSSAAARISSSPASPRRTRPRSVLCGRSTASIFSTTA